MFCMIACRSVFSNAISSCKVSARHALLSAMYAIQLPLISIGGAPDHWTHPMIGFSNYHSFLPECNAHAQFGSFISASIESHPPL